MDVIGGEGRDMNTVSLLELIDIATGERSPVREFDGLIQSPQFSSDGDSLVYNSGGFIFRYEFASKKSYRIPTHYCDDCTHSHVLSPNGEYIALTHRTHEDGLPRIYTVSKGIPRLVTPFAPNYVHGRSPDGDTLVYYSQRNGFCDIYSIHAEGGVERRLTFGDAVNKAPEFSPCGKYIYFSSSSNGLMRLCRMDSGGGNVTEIHADSYNNLYPHVSPDGKHIAYIACGSDALLTEIPFCSEAEIRLVPVGGGETIPLVSIFGGDGTMAVNSWSPCGTKIAFVSYRVI